MKKTIVAVTALVGVLAMSFPVMAASPTAATSLAPGVLGARAPKAQTAAETASTEALASSLLSSGAVETQAAATAVADSLTAMDAAKEVDEEALKKECTAIYSSMTAEQKAQIDAAASKRGLSAEEAIGNYIAADTSIPGSSTVTWNENICKSSVDGKAGSINLILIKAKADVIASAIKDTNGKTVLTVFDFAVQDGKNYKTLDTVIGVKGVKATDTTETIAAKQLVDGKWVNVKITGFANGGLSLHLTKSGPVKVERLK